MSTSPSPSLPAHSTHLIVGSHVQRDGQTLAGLDAGQRGVQGELADRNAHALGPQVAQAQDPLPVRDNHRPDVVLRPDGGQVGSGIFVGWHKGWRDQARRVWGQRRSGEIR